MRSHSTTSCTCRQRVYRPCARCGRLFYLRSRVDRSHVQRYCSRACIVTPEPERFWSKVRKGDGCWYWTACTSGGYGAFNPTGTRRHTTAHRVAWRLTYGPIPEGKFVCHRCDNPRCCRPDHLFLGDAADNNQDRSRKGRHPLAKLSPALVRDIRRRYAAGENQRQLADAFQVSQATIAGVTSRRLWKHVE